MDLNFHINNNYKPNQTQPFIFAQAKQNSRNFIQQQQYNPVLTQNEQLNKNPPRQMNQSFNTHSIIPEQRLFQSDNQYIYKKEQNPSVSPNQHNNGNLFQRQVQQQQYQQPNNDIQFQGLMDLKFNPSSTKQSTQNTPQRENYFMQELEKTFQTRDLKGILDKIQQLKVQNDIQKREQQNIKQLIKSRQSNTSSNDIQQIKNKAYERSQPPSSGTDSQNIKTYQHKILILETNLKNLIQENEQLTVEIQKRTTKILETQDLQRKYQKQAQQTVIEFENFKNEKNLQNQKLFLEIQNLQEEMLQLHKKQLQSPEMQQLQEKAKQDDWRIRELESQYQNLQKQLRDNEQLYQQNIANYNKRLQDAEKGLEEKHRQLQQQLRDSIEIQNEKKQQDVEIEKLQKANDQIKNLLQDKENEIAKYKNESNTNARSLKEKEIIIKQLQQDNELIKQERSKLQKQFNEQESYIFKIEEELQKLLDEREILSQVQKKTSQQQESDINNQSQSNQRTEELEKELINSQEIIIELQQQNHELLGKLAEQRAKLEIFKENYKIDLQQQQEEAENNIIEQKEDEEERRVEGDQPVNDIENLVEKFKEIQQENYVLLEEIQARDQEIQQLNQQIEGLHEEKEQIEGVLNEQNANQIQQEEIEEARFDVILKGGLLSELTNGWIINVRDADDYNEVRQQNAIIVGLIGSSGVGKSHIASKIFGKKFDVPAEFQNNLCIGTSYGVMENGVLVLLEQQGFNYPVNWPINNENNNTNNNANNEQIIQEEEEQQERGDDTEEDNTNQNQNQNLGAEEEEFEQNLKDRFLSENLLQEFIVDRSDVIVVVLNELTYNEQRLVARYRKRYKDKFIIIIHNWREVQTIDQITQMIQQYVMLPFNIESKRVLMSGNTEADEDNNKNTIIFVDKHLSDNIIHLVLAKENSEAGKYFNESTFDYIIALLWQMQSTKNFDVIEEMKKFLYDCIELYSEASKDSIIVVPDESDNNQIKLICQYPPLILKKIPIDELGEINLFQAGMTLKYSLSFNDNLIILRIDTPGMIVHNDNLSLEMDDENQYIIIEVERNVDINETQENILVNSREFGKFRLMTIGIPLQVMLVETSQEPNIQAENGVTEIKIAYKYSAEIINNEEETTNFQGYNEYEDYEGDQ